MLLTLMAAASWQVCAQDPPADSPASAVAPQAGTGTPERDVSLKQLPANLLDDQKNIWLFPARLKRRSVLVHTLAVVGATALLVMTCDPEEGRAFRDTTEFRGFNHVFSTFNTSVGLLLPPALFYGVGVIRRDAKAQKTALFTVEAVADAELVTTVMKDIDRRLRPAVVPLHGNFSDTWFQSGGDFWRGAGSFPSGHTIAAAAIATVAARRYGRDHRWVPYVAYGLTAVVAFSRLTLSAHFLSDVCVGGVLGYTISRYAVLHQ